MCTQLTNLRIVRRYRPEKWRKAWGNDSCVSAGSEEYFFHLTSAKSHCEYHRDRSGDFFDIVVDYVFCASFADDSNLIFGQWSGGLDSEGFFIARDILGFMDGDDPDNIKLLDLKNCNKKQVSDFFCSTQSGAYDLTKWISVNDTVGCPENYSDGKTTACRYESWSGGSNFTLNWHVISAYVDTRAVALDKELEQIFSRDC